MQPALALALIALLPLAARSGDREAGPSVARIASDLTNADASQRLRAVERLRDLGAAAAPVSGALATRLAKDPVGSVRRAAAEALGRSGVPSKATLGALASALREDRDPAVRGCAARALTELCSELCNALEALAEARSDSDSEVARTSREGLRSLRLPVGEPAARTLTRSRPEAAAVRAEAVQRSEEAADLPSRVASLLHGEGGATRPSFRLDGDRVVLELQLEHPRFVDDNAHHDAVRLALKLVAALPQISGLDVRILAHSGRLLSERRILMDQARQHLPRLEDPFESRRMREWWKAISTR